MTLGKFYERCIVSLVFFTGYQESFFNTSSYVIYMQILTLGKWYKIGTVSLVSYRVSGVFHSNVFLYNLESGYDAWDVFRTLYTFFSYI